MSFSALFAQSVAVRPQTTHTVDQNLTHGDLMHLKSLENELIPDVETLSLNLACLAAFHFLQEMASPYKSNSPF